jgi:hypothetical protein
MPASRSVVSVLLRELGDFLYTLKWRPAGGRCAAVLGRRTPDGGRARIAELPGRTASPSPSALANRPEVTRGAGFRPVDSP